MADKETRSLGGRIRRYRELANLSQTELGDRLNISYQQVQKYERGANRVKADTLVRIAKALGQPLSAFLDMGEGGKGGLVAEPRPDYGLSRDERELLHAWRSLGDEKARAAILTLLKASARRH